MVRLQTFFQRALDFQMKIVDLQPLAKRRTHFTFHNVSPIPFFLSAYDTKYWHFEQSAATHGQRALFCSMLRFFVCFRIGCRYEFSEKFASVFKEYFP